MCIRDRLDLELFAIQEWRGRNPLTGVPLLLLQTDRIKNSFSGNIVCESGKLCLGGVDAQLSREVDRKLQ